jgi:hypothetical protein
MFDLEQAIIQWRRQMLAAGIKTPVPLEELESHLRDEIDRQSRAGRSEMEAFAAAVQAIGPAQAVDGEFKKIDVRKAALRWRALEVFFGLFASAVPLGFCFQIFYSGARPAASLTPGQQWSGVLAMLTFAALAWGGRLSYRWFPAIQSKRARITTSAWILLAPVWWIIFMNVIVPRYEFTMGQFLTAFFWAFMTPGGAVIGFSWGMEAAAQKQKTSLSA